jgi:hypothetical protein
VNQKTAGLYVTLAKALNALDAAGEDPVIDIDRVLGLSGWVDRDPEAERWTVVEG